MTREEVYSECLSKLYESNFLMLELPTGFGKSKLSIDLVNNLVENKYKDKSVSMLLLVAKRVHKETWKREFEKWGGINVDSLTIECYESLKKHENERFDILVMDEVHHINSDLRLDALKTVDFGNAIGLSATIPNKLKMYFQYTYHMQIVSCGIADAIENEVLPEPKIILLPLQLDGKNLSETLEVNPKIKGKVYHDVYEKRWTYRNQRLHAILKCTQKQKLGEMNAQILKMKNLYARTRQEFFKNKWLHSCGERLQYLAYLKNDIIKDILEKLDKDRTITFCKTIEQAEILGNHCIHSKNKDSDQIYNDFNNRKIDHIVSVNILNENANLTDCKYAIFANYSSSEVIGPQRLGRSLRHKSPIIIMPFYEGTREQEILENMIKDFNKDAIYTIHTLGEMEEFIKK